MKSLVFVLSIAALACVGFCDQDNKLYDLLGVSRSADQKEIRKAFKKLALSKHPDKNQDNPKAHEEFLEINRAYEVLKDEDMRKKYDMYGEEGLKEDGPQQRRYESWKFYQQNFGIYDDDPEIITLSRADFEASIQNTDDLWFVNYYSPHCSHCHQLAPDWRELARELEGVIRIGAVNCEDDWRLCQQQGIRSYPSLIFYPNKEKYYGDKTHEKLLTYALKQVRSTVVELWSGNFDSVIEEEDRSSRPWLISYCGEGGDCLLRNTAIKLSSMLNELVNVAEVDCFSNTDLCAKLGVEYGTYYYPNNNIRKDNALEIVSLDAKEIAAAVLAEIPDITTLADAELEDLFKDLKERRGLPWVVHFVSSDDLELELRKLPVLLNDVNVGRVDCREQSSACQSLHLHTFPVFAVFKLGGGHEVYHGRHTAHDIAAFAHDSAQSSVRVLSPADFPNPVINSKEPWFVDFYAPWCPPCMRLLPEFRKAAKRLGDKINFGTVDCATHASLCQQYKVRSYPTTLFYNQSVPHQFHGHHHVNHIVEFLQDTLHPPVMVLDSKSFDSNVNHKQSDDVWLVDFYAPWCGPCQQLAGEWRKLAKALASTPHIHVAQVDCDANKDVCNKQNIRGYPAIRLYPTGTTNANNFQTYTGWFRDAQSIKAWAYEFLPSSVTMLNRQKFQQMLSDNNLWIVDFYAPWCGHCQVFAPEFERIAQTMKGSVKAGKVNCDAEPRVCREAGVGAYPTVKLYQKPKHGSKKNIYGDEVDSQSADHIINMLKQKVKELRLQDRSDL